VKRGTGIINNELYIGQLIWNRLRYIKDPSTGKRVSRFNPQSESIIRDHRGPESLRRTATGGRGFAGADRKVRRNDRFRPFILVFCHVGRSETVDRPDKRCRQTPDGKY
jgi:hypothetical protein